jgi:hypothetical protein
MCSHPAPRSRDHGVSQVLWSEVQPNSFGTMAGRVFRKSSRPGMSTGDDTLAEQRLDDFGSMSLSRCAVRIHWQWTSTWRLCGAAYSGSAVDGTLTRRLTLLAVKALRFLEAEVAEVADHASEKGEVPRETPCLSLGVLLLRLRHLREPCHLSV